MLKISDKKQSVIKITVLSTLAALLSLSILPFAGCTNNVQHTVNDNVSDSIYNTEIQPTDTAQTPKQLGLLPSEEGDSSGQVTLANLANPTNPAIPNGAQPAAGAHVKGASTRIKTTTAYQPPESLLPMLNTPVVDITNTLSVAEIAALNHKVRDIYEEGLLQIGVVIVPTTGDMPLFDYAMQVANLWQLGDANKDNGLLILMAINDRNIYILTGLGIEEQLPDARVANAIDTLMTPEFKQGRFAQGLAKGIDALAEDVRTASK